MDTTSIKKEHRFFENNIGIDLEQLNSYIHGIYDHMVMTELLPNNEKTKKLGMTIDITEKYNIFKYENSEIIKLKNAIFDMTKEACQYYNIDFDKQNYQLHGWFNLWKLLRTDKIEEKSWHFHDMVGAPHFHGYYSLNAEPSVTYYKINNVLIERKNINNIAILSETGHEHAPGDWLVESDRITIAYDILPKNQCGEEKPWIALTKSKNNDR